MTHSSDNVAGADPSSEAEASQARSQPNLRPGEIVLMHLGSDPDDGTTLDASALPTVIDRIRAQGYSFVTLHGLAG